MMQNDGALGSRLLSIWPTGPPDPVIVGISRRQSNTFSQSGKGNAVLVAANRPPVATLGRSRFLFLFSPRGLSPHEEKIGREGRLRRPGPLVRDSGGLASATLGKGVGLSAANADNDGIWGVMGSLGGNRGLKDPGPL